jgi:ABC transport system ATP-binding/permease protein
MKTCPTCGKRNADDHKFCLQCGRPFDAAGAPVIAGNLDATVRWSQHTPGPRGQLQSAVAVDKLFGLKPRLVIGRAPDCDICLPHPTVSRHHALLERLPDGLRLRDLGSVNGVYLAGQRAYDPVWLQERERVGIGPFLFTLAGGVLYSLDSSQSLRLEARRLEKVVPLGRGRTRKLLDNINLAVEPGEFVSLLGPSGSGKSTLMDCLNGRRPATAGKVLANGEDFYRHFDNFRQSLGYVPQRDIVHTQLTVYRALYYTARLRLPTDTEPGELATRIEDVLRAMELDAHRHTLVANLSGGQIKRVSLGAELLARPCLLYIDEATSGLDAGTEARMMRLFRQLADEGKSVICITHNVDNVDRSNLVLVLCRGKLVYFGPPREAPPYFGVTALSEVYDRLADKEPEAWEQQFEASPLHQEFVAKRLAGEAPVTETEEPAAEKPLATLRQLLPEFPSARLPAVRGRAVDRPQRPPLWHQFRVLTARYAELMWGDRRSLRLLALQAPVVALFVLLGFVHKPYQEPILVPRRLEEGERRALRGVDAVVDRLRTDRDLTPAEVAVLERTPVPSGPGEEPLNAAEVVEGLRKLDRAGVLPRLLESTGPVIPERTMPNPSYNYMLMFMLAVTVIWFGCNNAAKEIVKEQAIYGRERAVNLGVLPYLASKFLVLGLISAVQTLLLMAVIYGALTLLHEYFGHDLPHPAYRLDYLPQYGVLVLLALAGVALGLLLSACVASADRASTLLPYVLIPQIILGGGIIPISGGILYVMAALGSPVYWAFRAIHRGATEFPPDFPYYMDYRDSVWLSCAGLLAQTAVLLLATAWCLRRKDVRRA